MQIMFIEWASPLADLCYDNFIEQKKIGHLIKFNPKWSQKIICTSFIVTLDSHKNWLWFK